MILVVWLILVLRWLGLRSMVFVLGLGCVDCCWRAPDFGGLCGSGACQVSFVAWFGVNG